jgi:ATP-dependent DNA helicase RecG
MDRPRAEGARRLAGWPRRLRGPCAGPGASDLLPDAPARRRLAYDELFAHQLTLALARATRRRGKGVAPVATGAAVAKVLAALPYRPTGAQERAIAEIAADMATPSG